MSPVEPMDFAGCFLGGNKTWLDMDVSKNRGENPQNGWFVMENPIKMG